MKTYTDDFYELLKEARKQHCAIGAFNIFNYSSAKAAVLAADELKAPIILQTSMKTVEQLTPELIRNMVTSLAGTVEVPVILHLDHCTDPDMAYKCIDRGWNSVMIDISSKSFQQNVDVTKKVVAYADNKKVRVEGELGVISGAEDHIVVDQAIYTDYEEALDYVEQTGIHAFAPSVGTAHGVYAGEIHLNFELMERLGRGTETPLVIHGGTGLSDEDFARFIQGGASKINVSTAIKYAYVDSMKEYLKKHDMEYNPLKLDDFVECAIKKTVKEHIIKFKSNDFNLSAFRG